MGNVSILKNVVKLDNLTTKKRVAQALESGRRSIKASKARRDKESSYLTEIKLRF